MKEGSNVSKSAKPAGPNNFDSMSKKDKIVAAREWVANTSSGNAKDDAKTYDSLLNHSGINSNNNPFKVENGVNVRRHPSNVAPRGNR